MSDRAEVQPWHLAEAKRVHGCSMDPGGSDYEAWCEVHEEDGHDGALECALGRATQDAYAQALADNDARHVHRLRSIANATLQAVANMDDFEVAAIVEQMRGAAECLEQEADAIESGAHYGVDDAD